MKKITASVIKFVERFLLPIWGVMIGGFMISQNFSEMNQNYYSIYRRFGNWFITDCDILPILWFITPVVGATFIVGSIMLFLGKKEFPKNFKPGPLLKSVLILVAISAILLTIVALMPRTAEIFGCSVEYVSDRYRFR